LNVSVAFNLGFTFRWRVIMVRPPSGPMFGIPHPTLKQLIEEIFGERNWHA
jgi:hypothetical protein